jgi:hypothetical protein
MPIAFTTSTRMVSVLAGIIGDVCCLPSQWQALLLRIAIPFSAMKFILYDQKVGSA